VSSRTIALHCCQSSAIKGNFFSRNFSIANKNEKDYYSRFRAAQQKFFTTVFLSRRGAVSVFLSWSTADIDSPFLLFRVG
jgi:hypothetical protein